MIRTTDKKSFLPKVILQIGISKLYTTRDINIETIPSYGLLIVPERYNENLVEKTDLTLKKNEKLLKNIQI